MALQKPNNRRLLNKDEEDERKASEKFFLPTLEELTAIEEKAKEDAAAAVSSQMADPMRNRNDLGRVAMQDAKREMLAEHENVVNEQKQKIERAKQEYEAYPLIDRIGLGSSSLMADIARDNIKKQENEYDRMTMTEPEYAKKHKADFGESVEQIVQSAGYGAAKSFGQAADVISATVAGLKSAGKWLGGEGDDESSAAKEFARGFQNRLADTEKSLYDEIDAEYQRERQRNAKVNGELNVFAGYVDQAAHSFGEQALMFWTASMSSALFGGTKAFTAISSKADDLAKSGKKGMQMLGQALGKINAGSVGGATSMFITSSAQSTKEAILDMRQQNEEAAAYGMPKKYTDDEIMEKSALYGFLNGVSEVGLEYAIGGVTGAAGSILPKGKVKNPFLTAVLSYLKGSAGEGFEESVQTLASTGIKRAIYDPTAEVDWREVLDSGIVGMLTGVGMGAPSFIRNTSVGVSAMRDVTSTAKATNRVNTDAQAGVVASVSAAKAKAYGQMAEQVRNTDSENADTIASIYEWAAGRQQEIADAMADDTKRKKIIDENTKDTRAAIQRMRDTNPDFAETERTGLASGAKDEDIRMAGELSSALGKKIRFFREDAKNGTINNGEYHEDTGEIWINTRSKNVKAQIVAHELTHSIEKKDGYRQLVDLTMNKLEEEQKAKGKTLDDLYREKETLYADGGVRLASYDEITSELVAEYVEKRLLTDEASIKSLVSENRTLGQRIREWFDSLLAKMGNASAKEREYIRQMRDVYARALGENIENNGSSVRFSLSVPVEESKNLIAVHNLNADKLLKALDLGGMPMPSIAIAKAEGGHEDFGDISLVFDKSTIDPQASAANKVYSGDAYTPTYPTVEYKVNEAVESKVREKYYELSKRIGSDEARAMYRYAENLDDSLNRDGGEDGMIQRLYDDTGMMQIYLQDVGRGKVEPIMREVTEKMTEGQVFLSEYLIEVLGEELISGIKAPDGVIPSVHRRAYMEAHGAEIRDAYKQMRIELYGDSKTEANQKAKEVKTMDLLKLLNDAYRYIHNGGTTVKTVTDTNATDDAIRAAADDGYREWIDGLFRGVQEKYGIRNQQDTFTKSGNRRSWEATHYEETLENVVRAMKESGEKGIGGFGDGDIFGASTQEFSSIEDIKKTAGRIQNLTNGEYQDIKRGFRERFSELAGRLPKNKNSLSAMDGAANMLVKAVVKYKTKKGIDGYLRRESQGWANYSPDVTEELISLVNDIRAMPTQYFEAKPQRAVSFDEVAAFVIPRNADTKVKQELLNRGYSIAEYDPDVPGDRAKVLNGMDKYKFSISKSDNPDNKRVMQKRSAADEAEQTVQQIRNDIAEDEARYRELSDTVMSNERFNAMMPDEQNAILDEMQSLRERIDRANQIVQDMSYEQDMGDDVPMPRDEDVPPQRRSAQAEYGEPETVEVAGEEDQKLTRKVLHKNIMDRIKERFSERGFDFDKVLAKAKDLSTFATVDNTPQRVMEKSLGYKEGRELSDLTIDQAAKNETEAIRWLNGFTDKKDGVLAKLSKKYNIKPGSKESAAAQMYAEGFYVSDKNEIVEYGDRELAADFPDAQVRENIKGLAHDPIIRQIYDETLDAINASRTRNAFPEIQKLDNYYLHFRAMDDTFSRLGIPFNPNDIRAKDLPTDLNGVTADLKPGQPYFASAKHRLGKRTSFDLLGGMEKYLTSAKNQIYHIDDIQTLRALRNYVADMYGQAEGLANLDDLSDEEVEARIKDVYGSHLSTFAKFLNEEANVLAGKTSLIDRGLEGVIGRRGITFLNDVNRQVGANMVGYNISSSLTNFLAPVQAFAKMNKAAFVKGFAQTVENRMKSITGNGDDFAQKSDVIVRRKGADRFHRTAWQKMSDPGYLLMGMVDDISTEIIARAKYNELTAKGMDAETANRETDKWVSRLMGDRSLGQMPQIFNSKMLGLVTKFQLEVRNQLDSQFYDTIKEAQVQYEEIGDKAKRNAKTAAKVAATFAELALAQHVFGSMFESIAGYNPAFDIIEVLAKVIGLDDDEESEDTVLDNIEQGVLALIEDLPYSSVLMDGGRVPMSAALPISELVTGEDQYGNGDDRFGGALQRMKTVAEAVPYYALPGGYGQIKKTAKGLSMFFGDKAVTGSYTDSGNLRFPVEATPGNIAQAAVFGQWASENARDYFDNERKPANKRQTMGYAESGLEWKEFQRYRDQISKLDRDADKLALIKSLDIDQTAKEALYRYIVASAKKDDDGNIIGSSEDERLAALYAKGLDFDDFLDAKQMQSALNADESMTANQRASRFLAWTASQGYTDAQADVIGENFGFSSGFRVKSETYQKIVDGGVDPDNAVKVSDALAGKTKTADKINAVWSTGLSGNQLDLAVKSVLSEKAYERYRIVVDANIPLEIYTWALLNADQDAEGEKGHGSVNNTERELILSQLALPRKDLSALWLALGGSEKSNPYSGISVKIEMPKIEMPKIEMPKIELPKIGG